MVYHIDFPAPDTAVEWTLTEDGVECSERSYQPTFYVATTSRGDTDLSQIRSGLREHPDVVAIREESHRPGWRHDAHSMLAVDVTHLEAVDNLASTVGRVGWPHDVRCFNVDLSRQFRYCLETGTDPTPSRNLRVCRLAASPTALANDLDELTLEIDSECRTIEGATVRVAAVVEDALDELDPDVLQVSSSELIPALFEAGGPEYQLGREPGYQQLAGRSTFGSYGKVGHSPARYHLPGRAIVDESNTFFLKEANLDGVIDMVNRSRKPLQEAAWASIGNILTAIQIREAIDRDVLVPWRSWRPEYFKSASTLDDADRGGFTFAPDVGFHEDVHELDFSSLYPNIMITRNISPETVCCDCHPDREDVPGLGYSICPDEGYLGDVLEPLVSDRDRIKEQIRECEDPERIERLEGASAAIKWILVSCFGYQGFSNAKFGRIECHEAINAFARKILLDAKATLEASGWRVVHGIVDSIWVTAMDEYEQDPLEEVASAITDDTGIRLEYEGAFDWVAFCPRRTSDAGALTRYFGKRAGEPLDADSSIKRRGIEARQRSTPPFVEEVQLSLIRELARSRSPEVVCDRLQSSIRDLERGDVGPPRLAVRNQVSKPVDEYTQATRNVAALERAAELGLETHPGQDVEYVVVDDGRDGRDRVSLLYEDPDGYDAEFYTDELIRAAESVLSPLEWREKDIRQHLAERIDASIQAYN